jgi:ribosomal protein L37AE/L43A
VSDKAPPCPFCDSASNHREQLARGWFCSACARSFVLNEAGELVEWATTQHGRPQRKRDVRDVNGVQMDDP